MTMRRPCGALVALALVLTFGATTLAQTPPATPVATAVPTGPHPAPVEEVFHGCPGAGDLPAHAALNLQKNRIDTAAWQPVTLGALLALPPTTAVAANNGVPVEVEAFLIAVKQEGQESPNCRSLTDDDVHLWIAADPHASKAQAVIVEVTPRVRALHPGWTLAALKRAAYRRAKVRVSGWTMFDPEHPDQVGRFRFTEWEVHPVCRIDILRPSGTWATL